MTGSRAPSQAGASGGDGPGPGPFRLLVTLPALDEEATIADVIGRIPPAIPGISTVDVLVIDDGSRDRTAELARRAGARVASHGQPRGVGAAFHTALAHGIAAGSDLIVSIDADGQFDPGDIPLLIAPVVEGRADCTTASRFKDPALVPRMPALKRWGNRMMSRLISRLAGQRFEDVSCGMRCYGRAAALKLHLLGQFTYTQEVLLNLVFKGMRVVEVPIRVRGERAHGRSRVAHSLLRYAVRSSQIIFRCYRDYRPMRLFGGVASALLVPALVLAVFLAVHWWLTGAPSPHKWAGFASATLVALALILLHLGLVGDMLVRHRVYLEELLEHERRRSGTGRPGT